MNQMQYTTSAFCIAEARAYHRTIRRRCVGSAEPPTWAHVRQCTTSASSMTKAGVCRRVIRKRFGGDLGEPLAMTNVGYLYTIGRGPLNNPDEAMRWYRQAADLARCADGLPGSDAVVPQGRGLPPTCHQSSASPETHRPSKESDHSRPKMLNRLNVPSPRPSRMNRLCDCLFPTARSEMPSPLKSAPATDVGPAPASTLSARPNVPSPCPSRDRHWTADEEHGTRIGRRHRSTSVRGPGLPTDRVFGGSHPSELSSRSPPRRVSQPSNVFSDIQLWRYPQMTANPLMCGRRLRNVRRIGRRSRYERYEQSVDRRGR